MPNKLDLNIQKILQDWKISDALRELIANAYDEAKLSKTKQPSISYNDLTKEVTIKDFGRGIRPEHFTQNENREKNESSIVVGKFGIGLKDAISVLYRYQKPLVFKTSHNTFWPAEDFKTGTTDKIKTLHMEYDNNTIPEGTEIIIGDIKKSDYDEAIANFLENLHLEKIASSKKGEIYKKDGIASIFYNGMKISTDENFMFSYNILEANTKLRKSLNRERKMISRDAYRDIVISILKSCINKDNQYLINLILENTNDSNNEWSFVDIQKLVFKNSDRNLIAVSNEDLENPAFITYAKEQNRELIYISSSNYNSICNDSSTVNNSIDKFGYDFVNNYKTEEVSEHELTSQEKNNWSWAIKKVNELAKIWPLWKFDFPRTKIYIIKDHPNANGISSFGRIEIVKRVLSDKAKLFNTLIHEICHTTSNATDATIDFENMLTEAFYYVLQLKE